MNIPVNNIVEKRQDLSYSRYAIETVDSTVKSSSNWKKALIIVSLAVVITGVVCLILAATILAPPSVIEALIIVGSQCLEIGGVALLINGIMKISEKLNKSKKQEEGRSELLKYRKIATKNELLQEATERSRFDNKASEDKSGLSSDA